jgi:hypothetical protein
MYHQFQTQYETTVYICSFIYLNAYIISSKIKMRTTIQKKYNIYNIRIFELRKHLTIK